MSRSDWFWFNALGASAAVHVGRRTDNETLTFCHQARQAVDRSVHAQALAMDEIESLLFGAKVDAYREQPVEAIVAQLAEDQEMRNGRRAPRAPATSSDGSSETDVARRRRQVADRRDLQRIVEYRISRFQEDPDRALLVELLSLAQDEQQSSDLSRQVSGHNLAVFVGKHLSRFDGPNALLEAARHSDIQRDLLGRLDDDEIDDLHGNHRAERAEVAWRLAESIGDTRLLDEIVDDLMMREVVSPKEGMALAKCLDARFLLEGDESDLRHAITLIRNAIRSDPFLSVTERLNMVSPAVNLFIWTNEVRPLADAVRDLTGALELLPRAHPDRHLATRTLSLAMSQAFKAWPTAELGLTAFKLSIAGCQDGQRTVHSLLRLGSAALDLADVPDMDHADLINQSAAALDEAIDLVCEGSATRDAAGVTPELLRVRAECAVREAKLDGSTRTLYSISRTIATQRSKFTPDSPLWFRLSQADAVVDEALWLASGKSRDLESAIHSARQAIVDAPYYAHRQRDRARLARLVAARVRHCRGRDRQQALKDLVEQIEDTLDEFRERSRYESFEALTTWVNDYKNLATVVGRVLVEVGRTSEAATALEELRCFHVGVAATERERVIATLKDPSDADAFSRACDELRALELRLARAFDGERDVRSLEIQPDTLTNLTSRRNMLWAQLDSLLRDAGQRASAPGIRLSSLQKSLTKSSALVFLLPPTPLDSQPSAIVLRHDDVAATSLRLGGVDLDELLEGSLKLGHQRFAGDPTAFVTRLCDAVNDVFVAPVLAEIGEPIDQLLVVPVGPLALLPVHAIVTGAPRIVRWLLKAEQVLGERHGHGWSDVATIDGEFSLNHLKMVGPAQRAIEEAASSRKDIPASGSQVDPLAAIAGADSFVALCHGHARPGVGGTNLATAAGPLLFDDLRSISQRHRSTAFLASCCTRTPLQLMPDEVFGFVDELANAGFATVIAASWEVRWEVAAVAVLQFTRLAQDAPNETAAAIITATTRWLRTAGPSDVADLIATLQTRSADGGPALGELGGILRRSGLLDFSHPIDWAAFSACG